MTMMAPELKPLGLWHGLRGVSAPARHLGRQMVQLPLVNAEDLAAILQRDVSGLYSLLSELAAKDFLGSVPLACLRSPSRRYYLKAKALAELGLSGLTWHEPSGLCRLLERMTALDSVYRVAAQLGRQGLGCPTEFQWVDAVSFDCAVRFGDCWIVIMETGLLRAEGGIDGRLEQLGRDLTSLASDRGHPRPSLVCCVVKDRWEVELVSAAARRQGIGDWVAIYGSGGDPWRGPSNMGASSGWVRQRFADREWGERAWLNRVNRSPWSGKGGMDRYRVLDTAAEWPGMTVGLAKAVLGEGETGRRAQLACKALFEAGLLHRQRYRREYLYLLSGNGMELMSMLDRVAPAPCTKQTRLSLWLKGEAPVRHDLEVIKLMAGLVRMGAPMAAGWRLWEHLGDQGGTAPDGLVFLQHSPYGPGWYLLEYEISAEAESRVASKLRGYGSDRRRYDLPLLLVAKNGKVELEFHRQGRALGLRMLTTTVDRLKLPGPVGDMGRWSRYGEAVDIR